MLVPDDLRTTPAALRIVDGSSYDVLAPVIQVAALKYVYLPIRTRAGLPVRLVVKAYGVVRTTMHDVQITVGSNSTHEV